MVGIPSADLDFYWFPFSLPGSSLAPLFLLFISSFFLVFLFLSAMVGVTVAVIRGLLQLLLLVVSAKVHVPARSPYYTEHAWTS